jgi:hypothetical protein
VGIGRRVNTECPTSTLMRHGGGGFENGDCVPGTSSHTCLAATSHVGLGLLEAPIPEE